MSAPIIASFFDAISSVVSVGYSFSCDASVVDESTRISFGGGGLIVSSLLRGGGGGGSFSLP